MKHSFRAMFALSSILLCTACASAQIDPKFETVYDCHSTSYTIASTPWRTFTNVGPKSWHIPDIPVYAYAGATTRDQIKVGGLKTGIRSKLADQVTLNLDVAYHTQTGLKAGFRFFIGVSL